ncbi:MAG TPA: helix-turn-helix domain-containing protein [Gemmatimonadaceae bacterium]|jgi:AcrR family transcriptional regulator
MAVKREPPLRAPQQTRSIETFNRMLDAAEDLLCSVSFDEMTIADVAAKARVTIGAFYARFRDKEALLRQLEQRMNDDFLALNDENSGDLEQVSFDGMVLSHHRRLIAVYRRRRGIARALVLRSHSDGALKRRLDKLSNRTLPEFARAIRKNAAIDHPHPERAIRFALVAVRSVCREVVLFREGWPDASPVSDDELARELARQFLNYLGGAAQR